jgi:hypothetical protein
LLPEIDQAIYAFASRIGTPVHDINIKGGGIESENSLRRIVPNEVLTLLALLVKRDKY